MRGKKNETQKILTRRNSADGVYIPLLVCSAATTGGRGGTFCRRRRRRRHRYRGIHGRPGRRPITQPLAAPTEVRAPGSHLSQSVKRAAAATACTERSIRLVGGGADDSNNMPCTNDAHSSYVLVAGHGDDDEFDICRQVTKLNKLPNNNNNTLR